MMNHSRIMTDQHTILRGAGKRRGFAWWFSYHGGNILFGGAFVRQPANFQRLHSFGNSNLADAFPGRVLEGSVVASAMGKLTNTNAWELWEGWEKWKRGRTCRTGRTMFQGAGTPWAFQRSFA
jgi:hypothetical protein